MTCNAPSCLMETLSTILLTFIFIFIFFTVLKAAKRPNPTKLPPSPWKLPIIGNMHQLAASSLPHHTLRDLALTHGPIMHLHLGQVPAIVVSSPEIAKEVLKAHDTNFSDRPYSLASTIMSYNNINIIFSPCNAYWRQLRKICTTELLSPRRVHSFLPVREEEVANLMAAISSSAGSPVDLSRMIYSTTYCITARAALGDKCEEQDRFISIVAEVAEELGGFCLSDMFPSIKVLEVASGFRGRVERLHRECDEILGDIIFRRRERNKTINDGGRKDLVDVLLELQADGTLESPLTDDSIKAVITDVLAAGSETSSTTVDWAMSEMIRNPRVMKETQVEVRKFFDEKGSADDIHELKWLTAVIKETLRLHPSAPLMPRECRQKCVISGYEIPAKTKVIVNIWATGRDPKYWTDADTFHPERFFDSAVDYRGAHFQYIPFGAGRRICPGMSFALPNVELPLAKLLYHFDWKMPQGKRIEDMDMTEKFGLTVPRKQKLVLIPIPYVLNNES